MINSSASKSYHKSLFWNCTQDTYWSSLDHVNQTKQSINQIYSNRGSQQFLGCPIWFLLISESMVVVVFFLVVNYVKIIRIFICLPKELHVHVISISHAFVHLFCLLQVARVQCIGWIVIPVSKKYTVL